MTRQKRVKQRALVLGRGAALGLAYYFTAHLPGLVPVMIAALSSLLAFQILIVRPKLTFRGRKGEDLALALLTGFAGAALKVFTGLIVGALLGVASAHGLPHLLAMVIGAAMVSGAYFSSAEEKGALTGLLVALPLLEQVADYELLAALGLRQVLPAVLATAYRSFSGLLTGWVTGLIAGTVVKMMVPGRLQEAGGRRREVPPSLEYLWEAVETGGELSVTRLKVGPDSSLAGKALQEVDLSGRFGASVLSLCRGELEISLPGGEEIVRPGDELLVVSPIEAVSTIVNMIKRK